MSYIYLRKSFLSLAKQSEFKDAKSRLQESLQAMSEELPEYRVNSNEEGTHFYCDVTVLKKVFSASSDIKKDAEQKAAELALNDLNQS